MTNFKQTKDQSGRVSQMWKDDKYAEIYEVKDMKEPNENGLRVYCSQWPNTFTFQIRTHGPTVGWLGNRAKAKKRDMIAHLKLSIQDVEELLAYMKEEAGR